ncbi:MAG: histidine phosphatase family protein [Spirochaetaceae bacterium]|nr:MAG: histidine phosphatase family protein [Spirochaetaceae bacterium]
MTEICMIRHGQTDWNAMARIQGCTDIPLNEIGRDQARAVAEMISRESGEWDAIWASPLSRALDTARIIADHLRMEPIHTDSDLQERNFGAAEGMNRDRRIERFGNGPIPGAESWEEVRQRSLEMIEKIRSIRPDQRVLVVTHGGVINSIMSHLSGGEIGPGKTIITNASAHLIAWEGAWRIQWFNRTADQRAGITSRRRDSSISSMRDLASPSLKL